MTSLKYIPLADPRFDTISSMIYRSYENACILWLEEVTNTLLEGRYHTYKEMLVEKCGEENVKEQLLFHGTKEQNINSIVSSGFDSSRNVTSAYGIGTYFAKEADYSKHYSRTNKQDDISYMILTNVACANPCRGSYNAAIDINRYDYAVDSLDSPTIYVIPNDAAALPRYVVAFYKNAPL